MKAITISAVVALLGASPAYAGGGSLGGGHAVSHNQGIDANTTQINQASNQASQGNVAIQQVNQYGEPFYFGGGIACPTPSLYVGGTGAGSSGYSAYGVHAGINIPLGGVIGRNCRDLSTEVLRQRQLDTQLTLIEKCAAFASAGIVIDPDVFPDLAVCRGISLRERPAPSESVPPAVAPGVQVNVPVRGKG